MATMMTEDTAMPRPEYDIDAAFAAFTATAAELADPEPAPELTESELARRLERELAATLGLTPPRR